jgi:xylan 1,4-beta-xylosidase
LSERRGYLRLHGQAHGLSLVDATAFVGRRQTEWRTESATQLEFAPRDEGESAGLTVFMSPNYHYDLMKVIRSGHAVVVLEKHVGDIAFRAAEESVADGPIRLQIESDAETYRFLYAVGEGPWKLLGTGQEKLIASEVANVWTGAYVGMFSACSSAPCKQPADFQWFDYKATYEARTK